MKPPKELLVVAEALGALCDKVAFVGGMVRGLLITDPAVEPARPTDDVDAIIDVRDRPSYYRLSEQLRRLGFEESTEEDAPLCRWLVRGVKVDVMPIDPAILGFSNVWYPSGITAVEEVRSGDILMRIVDAPHFVATKLEAFGSRGEGDFYHHDIEDVLAVIDGRGTLLDELGRAPKDLRSFVAFEIATLLDDARFVEALPGHLPGDSANQARLPMLLSRLRAIAALRGEQAQEVSAADEAATATIANAVTWTLLRSSNLLAAAYDGTSSTLTIEFRNRTVYVYDAVPQEIFSGLLKAASAGRYHHRWIRLRYRYRRIR